MFSFANPWGLLALLSIPAIIAVHLYRRRFPSMVVAGLFLWVGDSEVRDAGRTRDRLPITATLLLELLAATALAAVLSQPRIGEAGRAIHLVAVLDDTASMSAVGASGAVSDAAVNEIERRMHAFGRRAVITIVTTGIRPTLLVGPAAKWDDARNALTTWKPQATSHDPSAAWDLALQLGGQEARFLYLTDHRTAEAPSLPGRFELVAVGQPAGNVSLTSPRWSLDSETGLQAISFQVHRIGDSVSPVTLKGESAKKVIFTRELDVSSQGSTRAGFDVPGGLGELKITATSVDDSLALDSELNLVEPRRRAVRVAVTLSDDHPAREPLQRALDQLPNVETVERDAADLIVTSGDNLPEANPDLWWFGIGEPDAKTDQQVAENLSGPYVIDKRDPLVDGVGLDGVVWAGAVHVSLAVDPLISAGPYVLLFRLVGTPTTAIGANIDFGKSNLADSPDWPILITNLIGAVRDDRPGLRRWNFRSGESIELRLPNAAAVRSVPLTLTGPDGSRPLTRAKHVVIAPPARTGIYELRDGGNSIGRFAVNFEDPAESDLTACGSGQTLPTEPLIARGVALDTLYSWPVLAILACAIGIIIGDWYVLRPRLP